MWGLFLPPFHTAVIDSLVLNNKTKTTALVQLQQARARTYARVKEGVGQETPAQNVRTKGAQLPWQGMG